MLELSLVSYIVGDLRASQINDPTLRQVKQCLQNHNYDTFPKQFSRYRQKLIIRENILQLLYVVPHDLRKDMLGLCHLPWFSGHFGCGQKLTVLF